MANSGFRWPQHSLQTSYPIFFSFKHNGNHDKKQANSRLLPLWLLLHLQPTPRSATEVWGFVLFLDFFFMWIIFKVFIEFVTILFPSYIFGFSGPEACRILAVCVSVLVAQLCPTLCNPMDCSPPGSSVCEILQAEILECVAIFYSRGSFQPRDQIYTSCVRRRGLNHWMVRQVPATPFWLFE